MEKVSVIIPNYNGMSYLKTCLKSIKNQTFLEYSVILVDNGSSDGSVNLVRNEYSWVKLIDLPKNYGFCHAVNEGIRISKTPYVIFLNNDTEVFPDFVEQLLKGIEERPTAFSCSSMMIQDQERSKVDDAGNFYNAFGWGFARGKGKDISKYDKPSRIFAACAGAAIYRREYLNQMGLLDEEYFAYLEDLDLGYQAWIIGYENWYLPKAKVYHVGSGTSGSRYNELKIRYSARNSVYLIHKNMPLFQRILNLPFLLIGFFIKILFFTVKGYGKEYISGIKNGFFISYKKENYEKKVRFRWGNLGHYCRIQIALWINLFRRF